MRSLYAALWSGLLIVTANPATRVFAGDVASEFGLGTVQGFGSEAAAREHCHGDAVVWVDRKSGFYYPKYAPEFGTTARGSFTCYKEAKRADYWSIGGGEESIMSGNPGRVFPFNPEPECDYKIDKTTGKGFCAQPGV